MKTTPPSMPDDGTHISGSSPRRMAHGKVRHPESPGSRRGLFVGGVMRFFVGGVMPGRGLLVSPRSPGWQPGDTGHEHHPAVHAGRRHAHLRFEPTPHGTREGAPPGVPRLPPGAFCGRRYAVFLWTALCPAGGFLCPQEAPGGNPGTPGMKTTPPSMPDDGRHISGSSPRRMARGKVRHPESPGSRRGLFVDGVMPGLGLLVSPRSPGWQPGDTGHENHPAIHAG